MLNIFARKIHCKNFSKAVSAAALVSFLPSVSMAAPSESRLAAVEDCQFLGKIEGSSGYGKNLGWQPLAKSSALHRAEKIGASHIVWERLIPVGAFNGVAVARAYSCSS